MKRFRQGLTVGLVLLLLFALTVPALASDLAKQQAEYEKIQQQIAEIEKRINANQKESNSVTNEISRLEKEIQKTEEQLTYLETRLLTTEREIEATEKDLAEAEENLAFRQDMLKTRLRALYERGPVSYLEVIFNARSFTDLINRIGLLKRVVEQDAVIVDTIKLEKARIEEQKVLLENKLEELASLKQERERNRTALASRMAERNEYKKRLNSDRAEWEKNLRALEQVERELEALIREAQGKNPNAGAGTGTYTWPTPGYTRITSPFGPRNHPIFGGSSFHNGVDIGASMGAKIVAADSGTVLYAGWMTGYGQVVIIDHGKNISTLYAHCSVLMVKNNQKVVKGQQIAKVGSTGWSTGPHLHFEYRISGTRKNPLDYVRRP
ncbi:MAG TPA: peptidoglycan DD-metalloendopeptidase family protein [Firmicutes bacterium]|nr:peptidoglycan DD-metalloendopeptidase family protein [Bacillota bacterium]